MTQCVELTETPTATLAKRDAIMPQLTATGNAHVAAVVGVGVMGVYALLTSLLSVELMEGHMTTHVLPHVKM